MDDKTMERKNILIVHAEGIGDDVLSLPFLSVVSETFKNHRLFLVIAKGRRDLFIGQKRYTLVQTSEKEKIHSLFQKKYHMVFDLGTGYEHIQTRFGIDLDYEKYFGFGKPTLLPNEQQIPNDAGMLMWKQFLCIASLAGADIPKFIPTSFPISRNNMRYAKLLADLSGGKPLISICPGAVSNELKKWPPDYFAKVMGILRQTIQARFIIIGSMNEKPIAEAICEKLDFEVDSLMGVTTLGSAAYILKRSSLVISNDNGLMHLSGFVGAPTIGLFGVTDIEKWHPIGDKATTIVGKDKDVKNILPERVVKKSMEMLSTFGY